VTGVHPVKHARSRSAQQQVPWENHTTEELNQCYLEADELYMKGLEAQTT